MNSTNELTLSYLQGSSSWDETKSWISDFPSIGGQKKHLKWRTTLVYFCGREIESYFTSPILQPTLLNFSTFLQKMEALSFETFHHLHEFPNKLANHFKRWNLLNLKHLKIYIQTNLKADSLDCVILTHVHARCLILNNSKVDPQMR